MNDVSAPSSSPVLEVALQLGYGLLVVAFLLAFVRMVRGPAPMDRVLALDLMAGIALGALVLWSIQTGVVLYLDIALAIAVIAFVGTVAFALFLERNDPENP